MELIIGGAYQGKRVVAEKIFGLKEKEILDGETIQIEDAYEAKAISSFHMLIRRLMENGENTEAFFERLKEHTPDVVLISDEIGYGIVPMERFEREWREKTGRICCHAAGLSQHVIRVLAGNPVYIKGEPI